MLGRDGGLLRAVAIAHSCGAVADFNRLPVHSTANKMVNYKCSGGEMRKGWLHQNSAAQTVACRRFPRSRIQPGVPGRSPGSCFSGRNAFPSSQPKEMVRRDSGLEFLPTQLQWRGRAGFAPDFPFGQTAPGTPSSSSIGRIVSRSLVHQQGNSRFYWKSLVTPSLYQSSLVLDS